jgi:hypothetical protein
MINKLGKKYFLSIIVNIWMNVLHANSKRLTWGVHREKIYD